jgi:uncharacterized membrane protein
MLESTDKARLTALERTTQELATRLATLEARGGMHAGVDAPQSRIAEAVIEQPAATPAATSEPPRPPLAAPTTAAVSPGAGGTRPAVEDLLGGRVLAWLGGLAMLVGVVLLLAIAVSHGWLGEAARTLLAGATSLAMIAGGVWLHERRRRSDAAVATAGAGIAALFVTIAVGGPVYGVLPVAAAHALALGAGALAAAIAVRWQARAIGALGIVGALLAPVLAGAPGDGSTLALLWLAGLSGVAVVIWQRWNWLSVAVFATALAQWSWWLQGPASDGASLLVLTAFGALNVGAAIGFELRVPSARLRASSALLLALNATVLAVAGWQALDDATAARAWLGALAAAHVAVGLTTCSTRISRDVRLLALALGIVLADAAAAAILDGPLLAATWAAATAGFALLARRAVVRGRNARDELVVGVGLGGHLLLSTSQALLQAPPDALATTGPIALGAQLAIATTACAAFVAARFTAGVRPAWRLALDAVAMSGLAYLAALTLDGALLAAAFAAQAAALVTIGARARDDVATYGGLSFLGLALVHALAFEAPPPALVAGLQSVPAAALALGAVAATAARAASLLPRMRTVLTGATLVTLLYLASAALVTVVAGQLGQAMMSAMWAVSGLAALAAGLLRDHRTVRLGALCLLLATIAKVFLYDLAALQSLYRVASCIALGVLLLLAAALWQRIRPRALPDLRTAPPALR